jgi:hypothetical protein
MRESPSTAILLLAALPAAPKPLEGGERSVVTDRGHDDLIVVSHEALFVDTPASRCDACAQLLGEDDASDGYGIPGRGVYLWARGEETRLETVPLCTSCASAIGMTALARWEIEEEES